jgi:aryl-alcohol dehydrogenase-like predicted oxidoreductase
MSIPTRTLGRTGLEVTTIAYGAMELRGAPKGRDISEDEVGRLLNTVLDSGITLIDTSIDYGLSEERIGRHIGHRRDEYVLTAKCACPLTEDPEATRGVGPHDYSAANIIAGVEQSLRRMGTDHIDVLQVHISPSVEVLESNDVIGTLLDLQQQGKIGFLGMSGILPHLDDHIAMGVFDVFQIPYSVVQPEHADAIAAAAAAGAGVIIRGGAARGVPSKGSRAVERNPDLIGVWERAELETLLDGMSAMEFTLRHTLSHPGMTTNIVGTLNVEHLAQNIEATKKGPLPQELLAEAGRRVSAVLD